MPGRRVALLIATTVYTDQNLRSSRTSEQDIRRLRQLLLDPDAGGFDEVVLLANESKSGIERELERLLLHDRTPEDTVLVHMTGYGVWNNYSHLFFATAGTDLRMAWSTAMPAVVVGNILAESPARAKVVLLDNCLGAQPVLTDYLGTSSFLISATNQLTETVVRAIEAGAAGTLTELTEFVGKQLPQDSWQACGGAFDGEIRIARTHTQTETPVEARPEVQPDLLDLLGLPDANFDIQAAWQPRPWEETCRVPIGADENGQPVQLDIKISPDGGMGPHGMVIGADDATRADFLRSVVAGLAATHSSDAINFILLDYSGQNTFAPLWQLPHVSALLTEADATFLGRLRAALAGETNRRQEVIHAGRYKSVTEYEQARLAGEPLDPLPALVIVVDGLSELIAAHPDFVETFVMLGRLGKTMRIHMLLSSARLAQGDMRGLDGFLFYRVVMRTDTVAESRAVLGVPDAYELPDVAGAAYLKSGVHTVVRFTTATTARPVGESPDAPSVLDYVVGRLPGQGPPAHEVWLPPLDTPNSLDHLMPPLHVSEERGLCPENTSWAGQLKTPVGVVDKPFEQRRDLLWADFSGEAGHGAVVGRPQSGKSTLLQTLMVSMALTHTPREVQFHCLDLGGGKLAALQEIPHVVTVASAADGDPARQVLDLLSSLVDQREQRFREQGIESMAVSRDRGPSDDHASDVFLVVDGNPEGLQEQVENLVTRGLPYGVHVILSANQWADIRPEIRQMLGTRFELRLDDPSETEVDPKVAVQVPTRPGFGVTREKLQFLAALPRFDSSTSVEDLDEAARASAVKILQSRPTPLPDNEPVRPTRTIPIGTHEPGGPPVLLDFQTEPHLLALGDPAGKTTLLRTVLRGITEQYSVQEAALLLVDYRRGLFEFAQAPHLLRYAATADNLPEWTAEVVESLRNRVPGPWTGPELFVVVDDYDLVATREGNPLLPLREFLPVAKDVGLHMIIASRSGGHPQDPITSSLKEAVSPGVLMNANTPPGHAMMVTRETGQRPVQLTWTEAQR